MVSPLRVVIADESRRVQEELRGCLELLGHRVVGMANDGETLLAICAEADPDIVFIDQHIPDVSAANAAALVYERRPTQIILLASYCDRELVSDADQKHVSLYLLKPIHPDHVRAALQRCRQLRISELAQVEAGLGNSNLGGR